MDIAMEFSADFSDRKDDIVRLFAETFTASEGAEEGRLIGQLADDLLSNTRADDLFVFSCWEERALLGCIMFSRLTFLLDDRTIFILSPVAVKTSVQRRGIGQRILRFGLEELRHKAVDVAITYGDPKYYAKVGFAPITANIAQAPFALTYPNGWLAQSLNDRPLTPINGPARCVEALNKAIYW